MKKVVKLRKFLPADLDNVLKIENASFRSGEYSKKRFQRLYKNHAADFILASIANRPVGYILAYPNGSYLDLDSVAVDAPYRKMGIGRKMLARALKKARKIGLKKAILIVRTTNKPAIGFYKKFGFRYTKTIKKYYRDGGWAYKMEKAI